MPTVRVSRPFANGHHEAIVQPGDLITVTEDRARALSENGLIEPAGDVKAAPIPANKMAPKPVNKAASAPERRPRGRPPKVR